MAAFVGTRETLQPRSAKQHRGGGGGGKRGRAKDGADVAAAVAESSGVDVGGSHVDVKPDHNRSQSAEAGKLDVSIELRLLSILQLFCGG
jgi:hypothetical protein